MSNVKLIAQIPSAAGAGERAKYYDNCGADELYYFDAQSFEEGKEEDVKTIKEICRNADIPLNVFAKVKRFEDVKKMIYAGAKRVIVRLELANSADEIKEASDRFGAERVLLYIEETDVDKVVEAAENAPAAGFGGIVLGGDFAADTYAVCAAAAAKAGLPVFIAAESVDSAVVADCIQETKADGIILLEEKETDMMALKQELRGKSIEVNTFESAVAFDEFKLNADGMIPVITQDYKTNEVLMLAYMTKESFEKTVETGKMTYYSRSRDELWTKGDTSGHYQFVKSLDIDCDKDTILAKVAQVGAACHTGNRSCFYTNLLKKETEHKNPLVVFEDVFATIMDRKENPKEGSYTNYLFDKGVDKILKKVGEEATEIVIAAKNPDSDELKYEICDFLYHMMVLMAEQDVTWKEITDELAQRH